MLQHRQKAMYHMLIMKSTHHSHPGGSHYFSLIFSKLNYEQGTKNTVDNLIGVKYIKALKWWIYYPSLRMHSVNEGKGNTGYRIVHTPYSRRIQMEREWEDESERRRRYKEKGKKSFWQNPSVNTVGRQNVLGTSSNHANILKRSGKAAGCAEYKVKHRLVRIHVNKGDSEKKAGRWKQDRKICRQIAVRQNKHYRSHRAYVEK